MFVLLAAVVVVVVVVAFAVFSVVDVAAVIIRLVTFQFWTRSQKFVVIVGDCNVNWDDAYLLYFGVQHISQEV